LRARTHKERLFELEIQKQAHDRARNGQIAEWKQMLLIILIIVT
jgi:hypothetical protein